MTTGIKYGISKIDAMQTELFVQSAVMKKIIICGHLIIIGKVSPIEIMQKFPSEQKRY